MKKQTTLCLVASLFGAAAVFAQTTATTTPVGYTVSACYPNADTIVGTPLRSQSEQLAGALAADPDIASVPGSAVLTVSTTMTADALANTHYLKFTSGTDQGKFYSVTANTDTTVTIDLNGGATTALSGDTFVVIKIWTLAELFDPTVCTTDPITTGNAIVASLSQLGTGRRTEVLVPDYAGDGVNLVPAGTFYVHAGIWKKQGGGATDFGAQQLPPDGCFIIRHPPAVTAATSYTILGEVEMGNFQIPLSTLSTGKQDNSIGLLRPIDVTLNGLNLGGTPAFVDSLGQLGTQRRDELLVFANDATGVRNKVPVATYYRHAGIWKKQGGGATDFGNDIIPGGFGIMVRKYQTVDGSTAFWNNTPTY